MEDGALGVILVAGVNYPFDLVLLNSLDKNIKLVRNSAEDY